MSCMSAARVVVGQRRRIAWRTACSARASGGRATGAAARTRAPSSTSAPRFGQRLPRQRVHQVEIEVVEVGAAAISTARRASRASWMRPSACRCASSKLCMPIDSRLTPLARNARTCRASKVPGLASSVISASGVERQRARTSDSRRSIAAAPKQAGRAAADEDGVAPCGPRSAAAPISRSARSASRYSLFGHARRALRAN